MPSPGDLADLLGFNQCLLGLLHGQANYLPLAPPGNPLFKHGSALLRALKTTRDISEQSSIYSVKQVLYVEVT